MKELVIILLFAIACFYISCADEVLTPRLPEYLFFVHGDSLLLQAEKVDTSDLADKTFSMSALGGIGELTFYENGSVALTYLNCYRQDYSGKWKIEGDTVVATFTTVDGHFVEDKWKGFTHKYVFINQSLCEVQDGGRNFLMYYLSEAQGRRGE